MFKIPLQLLEHRCIQDQRLNINGPNTNKIGWIRACLLILLICKLPELSLCASVAGSKVEHEGFCPNKLNSNLWVDAQSTCERECNVDEVDCADFEKCCTNVCGLNSCVAARFSDGTPAQPDGEGVTEAPISTATCEGFICSQQGATCGIWLGQPICKCQDRCEKEPNFTCASDGLTYFNRCYMDAEACIRGVTITVVTCRFYLAGPPTSPLPQDTTANPTPTSSQEDPMFPMLYSNPHHQSVYVGGTVSFHCDVTGSQNLM
ncbi:hypothetical protein F7725_016033 [Dissostichus mawsoni]|uniref:Kazal-like domain-containing protein n=1 Tax=Dissostichus mawsoni TaxID=36200 RepID=A0A7J5Y3H5_DISMA|nr:hypothetical protein F7725_016033 [Dissostichus mawsoni]